MTVNNIVSCKQNKCEKKLAVFFTLWFIMLPGFLWNRLCQRSLVHRLQRWGSVQRWKWVWLKRSCRSAVHNMQCTGPASLATPTSSYRVALWIVVARVSPYRARTAHQRKQLSRVVTVILSTVVGFFSYVTVVEELQPTSILKFHRWTVFWKPRYRCFYTGSIRCYILNKLDASSNGIYAL